VAVIVVIPVILPVTLSVRVMAKVTEVGAVSFEKCDDEGWQKVGVKRCRT
jgi:hypothetical protein